MSNNFDRQLCDCHPDAYLILAGPLLATPVNWDVTSNPSFGISLNGTSVGTVPATTNNQWRGLWATTDPSITPDNVCPAIKEYIVNVVYDSFGYGNIAGFDVAWNNINHTVNWTQTYFDSSLIITTPETVNGVEATGAYPWASGIILIVGIDSRLNIACNVWWYAPVTPTPYLYNVFNMGISNYGNITFEYPPLVYSFQVNQSAGGVVTWTPTYPSNTYYSPGTVITLHVTANPGYTFDHWESTGATPTASGDNWVYTTTDSCTSLTPIYTKNEYWLEVIDGNNWWINPSTNALENPDDMTPHGTIWINPPVPYTDPGETSGDITYTGYTLRQQIHIKLVANDGYIGLDSVPPAGQGSQWSLNEQWGPTPDYFTPFSYMSLDGTVLFFGSHNLILTSNIFHIPYIINFGIDSNGTASIDDCSDTNDNYWYYYNTCQYYYEDTVNITATSNSDYRFDHWELSGCSISSGILTDASITIKIDQLFTYPASLSSVLVTPVFVINA